MTMLGGVILKTLPLGNLAVDDVDPRCQHCWDALLFACSGHLSPLYEVHGVQKSKYLSKYHNYM